MLRRVISPSLFGLIVLCFFLPWVNVSCQNYKIVSISGIHFVTGKTLVEPQMFKNQFGMGQYGMQNIPSKPSKEGKINPQLYVILALVCVITGLVLSFVKGRIGSLTTSISAVAGFIFIILQKFKLENELVQKSQGLIQLDFLLGFYLTLLLLLAAVAVNVYSLTQSEAPVTTTVKKPPESAFKFCPECGAKNEAGNVFCKECGTKFPE